MSARSVSWLLIVAASCSGASGSAGKAGGDGPTPPGTSSSEPAAVTRLAVLSSAGRGKGLPLAIGGGFAFVPCAAAGTCRVDLATGAVEVLPFQTREVGFAADNEWLYCSEAQKLALQRVPVRGDPKPERVMGNIAVTAMVVDGGQAFIASDDYGIVITAAGSAGKPTIVKLPAGARAVALAHDADRLYWIQVDGEERTEIVSMARAGGEPRVVVADAGRRPGALAVDRESVYWTDANHDDCTSGPGRVVRAARSGGDAEQLLEIKCPADVAVAGGDVYASGSEGLWRLPRGGGAAEALMSGVSIGEIAVAGDRVVFLRHPGTEDTSIEVVRSARP